MSLAILFVGAATAGVFGERFTEGLVLGANVTVQLGETDAGRVGGGLDVWYQVQWYTQRSARVDGQFHVWADEHPAANYGPAAHLWWVGGHWFSSAGARFAVDWPLRVGLSHGWWPGPGLGVESAAVIGTNGLAGLDLLGVVDAPWVSVRAGRAFGSHASDSGRVHLGAFAPLRWPENWDSVPDDWRDPRGDDGLLNQAHDHQLGTRETPGRAR